MKLRQILPALLGVLVVLFLLWKFSPQLDPALKAQADAAIARAESAQALAKQERLARQASDSARDAALDRVRGLVAASERHDRVEAGYRVALTTAQTTRDSLEVALAGWAAADSAKETERAARQETERALQMETAAKLRAQSVADSLSLVIPGLEESIRALEKSHECTIVGLIACPSRGTVALVTAVLTATIVVAAQ